MCGVIFQVGRPHDRAGIPPALYCTVRGKEMSKIQDITRWMARPDETNIKTVCFTAYVLKDGPKREAIGVARGNSAVLDGVTFTRSDVRFMDWFTSEGWPVYEVSGVTVAVTESLNGWFNVRSVTQEYADKSATDGDVFVMGKYGTVYYARKDGDAGRRLDYWYRTGAKPFDVRKLYTFLPIGFSHYSRVQLLHTSSRNYHRAVIERCLTIS